MKHEKVEIEVGIPEGYEFLRYGVPNPGELYIDYSKNQVEIARYVHLIPKIIVQETRWRTNLLEHYWFAVVNEDYEVESFKTSDCKYAEDNMRYDTGNFFKTEEECLAVWNDIAEYTRKKLKSRV